MKKKQSTQIKLMIPKAKWDLSPLITDRSKKGLIFLLLFSYIPHLTRIPIWTLPLIPLLLIWGYYTQIRKRYRPSRNLMRAIVLASVAAIFISYGSFLGRDPGITTLILLSALKLIEMKGFRDGFLIVFLSFFILFGNFLYSQDISTMIMMLLGIIFGTAVLLRINYGTGIQLGSGTILRRVIRFILLSLPLMLVLFLFFPRFPTALSLMEEADHNRQKAISGFNDRLTPGSFAELAQSNQPAFSVEFQQGRMPRQQDLYFRGNVLWHTNGRLWRPGVFAYSYNRSYIYRQNDGIDHTITMEPHNRHWLFALDYPVVIRRADFILPGQVYRTRFRVKEKLRYVVTSRRILSGRKDRLRPQEKVNGLQLPHDWQSPILRLGQEWKAAASQPSEIIDMGLRYFKENGFIYTLSPGQMNPYAPLEDFLFNQKRGFCEHYAATFCLLMRSAGVPARVVVGFQGGEYNNIGDYLQLRQSDAHAWCEVWLKDRGWIRIDPTRTVAPERILYGAAINRQIEQSGQDNRSEALNSARRQTFFKRVSVYFNYFWDNINRKWDQWVIMYNRYSQINILQKLGLGYVRRSVLFFAMIAMIIVIIFVILRIIRRTSKKRDPVQIQYIRFLRKSEKLGVPQKSWEGPLDHMRRVQAARPEKKAEIEAIVAIYIKLRYGREKNDQALFRRFRQTIGRF